MSDIERFMRFVEPDTNGGCWLWSGYCTPDDGYGRFRVGDDKLAAHRVSFALHGGDLDAHEAVLHSCDVTACVNPRHLHGGSLRRNVAEAISRGRKVPYVGDPITPEKRAAVLAHPGSLRHISRDLGIPKTTVIKIRRQAND